MKKQSDYIPIFKRYGYKIIGFWPYCHETDITLMIQGLILSTHIQCKPIFNRILDLPIGQLGQNE